VLFSRRDLYYVRWFGGSRPKGPTAVMREAELIDLLGQENRELYLVGSGAPRLGEQLRPWQHIRIADEASNQPSPLAVAQWGNRNYVADQLYTVEPLYVEPLLIGGKAV
jgi:tRNA A37 threonylcarbamoyladenosine modification protein TsaB